jgi:hypothetical protein
MAQSLCKMTLGRPYCEQYGEPYRRAIFHDFRDSKKKKGPVGVGPWVLTKKIKFIWQRGIIAQFSAQINFQDF